MWDVIMQCTFSQGYKISRQRARRAYVGGIGKRGTTKI